MNNDKIQDEKNLIKTLKESMKKTEKTITSLRLSLIKQLEIRTDKEVLVTSGWYTVANVNQITGVVVPRENGLKAIMPEEIKQVRERSRERRET